MFMKEGCKMKSHGNGREKSFGMANFLNVQSRSGTDER